MDQNIKTTTSLQDTFLNLLCTERVPLSIYLANGIRLVGQIVAFDAYIILLKSDSGLQAVYKHAISTILPSREIAWRTERTATEVIIKKRTALGVRRISTPESEQVEETK